MFSSMFLRKPMNAAANKDDTEKIHVRSFAQTVLTTLRQRNDDLAQAIQSETDEHEELVDELQVLRDQVEDMTELLDRHREALQEVSAALQRTLVKYAK